VAKRKPPRADLPAWVITLNNWLADKEWLAADLIRQMGEDEWKERVYSYLRGRVKDPSPAVFDALAKPFGRTGRELELGKQASGLQTRRGPLIPLNETGTLLPARKTPNMWSGETVDISDSSLSDQVFATIAEDNACAPKIEVGDELIVDLKASWGPGDYVLAVVAKRDNNVVCRKFRPLSTEDETVFKLVGTNVDYPPFEVRGPNDGAVIGRVVQVRKRL